MSDDAQKLDMDGIETALGKQAAAIRQLQNRMWAMQSAFLRFSDSSHVAVDSPLSELSPVEILRTPGAETTVITFAGLLTHFGVSPKEFARTFVERGCNVMFVKDFQQCWYQKGLLSLSTSMSETVEVLRGLIPSGTKSVRTIGSSAGGFAALHFGVRLDADRILAFGPQTRLRPGSFDKFANFESRRQDINFSSPDADVRSSFEACPDFRGKVDVHVGRDFKPDVFQARLIKDLPNVQIHKHAHDAHDIAVFLHLQGALDAIIDDFMS